VSLRSALVSMCFTMSRASPQLRNFAKRIIACETNGHESVPIKTPDAFHVFEKLRPPLATLMGNGGFRALLSRSLALASAEVPWLRALHVKSDGALEGLEETHAQLSLDVMSEGRAALLAQLLGLLVAFIGENLTLRLVNEVWPKATFSELDLIHGNQNEKTK
jgi:hypothetical protein